MEPSDTLSKITEVEGDLFNAPDGAALIHACNCQGSWGKGVAQAFRIKYPAAFTVYRSHCQKYLNTPQYHDPSETSSRRRVRLPEGSALVIPPQERDYNRPQGRKHWIICLFTSRGFGRNVSSVKVILENTDLAIADMKRQLDGHTGSEGTTVTELWSCRFNAGLFGVDWALTREMLEESELEVTVVQPPRE